MSGESPKQTPLRPFTPKPDKHAELRIGKQGVYLIEGDAKLKTLRLIPWSQFLASLGNS